MINTLITDDQDRDDPHMANSLATSAASGTQVGGNYGCWGSGSGPTHIYGVLKYCGPENVGPENVGPK